MPIRMPICISFVLVSHYVTGMVRGHRFCNPQTFLLLLCLKYALCAVIAGVYLDYWAGQEVRGSRQSKKNRRTKPAVLFFENL